MRNFKKFLIMLMICVLTMVMPLSASAAAKISKKSIATVTVETPKINTAETKLKVTETTQLKISGTQQKVTWKSNKPGTVQVTSKGKICAKKSGSAVITATVNGKKYSCHVTVVKPAGSGNSNNCHP